jgi:squalene cyclase
MDPRVQRAVEKGLDWVARTQSRLGHWTASNSYRVPMTALAGIALLCEGSTTMQGKYAENIRRCTDYLISRARPNGLIGEPNDYRYTYGHGFSMLFLSQVLGEEEDADRRETITEVLNRAVEFCCSAQTSAGGWGYVSAKDGNDFDEGSTTVTQVQGLRGCRNAGIPVPKEAIDRAIQYIYNCQMPDGGICYSSRSRGASRPAITAAAVACLFNAGDYESERVKKLLHYCEGTMYGKSGSLGNGGGHFHYAYYYYSQAVYRIGGQFWEDFRDRLYNHLLSQQAADGSWSGNIGPIYITSLNLTMLQLENNYLPIYQR